MSTLRTISNFKTALAGGGARPNLFEVSIPNLPTAAVEAGAEWDAETSKAFRFLCKTAALPASNISPIDIPFRGRILKVAGDRTFDPWTITIINDENFKIRTALELWMNGISKLDNNTGATTPNEYMTNASVYQLGRGKEAESSKNYESSGNAPLDPLRIYTFFGIFPTNIGAIDLSYDSSDTIEEYTVEFQVQYWSAGSDQDTGGANDQTNTQVK
jgi:hypothetical protein